MSKIYFLFGIHNHQPVGNDPYVFREAFENCYGPFNEILKEFPEIKCNIHISGPLYDWILENKPQYIKDLKEMSDLKQVEIIGGGYYEPVLSIISDKDKKAQLKVMSDFIKDKFNKIPKGIWLTERIWEPQMAKIISEANLKFTFLDDDHFRSAGIKDKELTGYYMTEDSGKPLAIFPINKKLRFKIPFSKVEESLDILKSFKNKEDVLVTVFDDGEKFGSWPTTYDWIYVKQWLRKFFELLEKNKNSIETITASEALKKFKPKGLVYIPTSSYREMDEWVMEPKDFWLYKDLKDRLRKFPDYQELRNYVSAGFFRNYFKKYPRANYMHKKMLYLSENINKKASNKKDKKIFYDLYKAQCNCGYWHGLFGGFYYGNIRNAIYENLIKAEKEFDKKYNKKSLIIEKADYDFDGFSEIIVKNEKIIYVFSQKGGTLLELDYKEKNFNLQNTITRREESYHQKIKSKKIKSRKGKMIKTQEIIYDKYERVSLVDHLMDKKITLNDFNKQKKFKSLSDDVYKFSVEKKERQMNLNYVYENKNLEFAKKISVGLNAGFKVKYNFQKNDLLKKFDFSTELNLFFESVRDVRIFSGKNEINLKRMRKFTKIKSLKIEDKFKGIILQFDFSKADVFITPIYSFANSQDGLEKVFQDVSILFIKKDMKREFELGVGIDKN
ncbi:MAG: DUF1926 domain-containing protein [Patescibacteria group bacterium]|nr:DUF1926 domain-containing protein [Patescibacteria group bacterium]